MDKLILAVTTPYANKVVKETVTGWIEMVKKEDHAALMIDTAEKMYSDARSELCKIQCPAFIISGSHDKTVGNDAPEEFSQGISRTEVYIYEGLGHGTFTEAKDFYDRVLAFLNC